MVADLTDPYEKHFDSHHEGELKASLHSLENAQCKTILSRDNELGRLVHVIPSGSSAKKRKLADFAGDVQNFSVKKRLIDPAEKVVKNLSALQRSLSSCIFNYEDILFTGRSPNNAAHFRDLVALHAANHVYKTRDHVVKNNSRAADQDGTNDRDLRDQGFTRPKILILLETRQQCVKWVDSVIKICDPDQQENKKRFMDAFSNDEAKFGEEKPLDFREIFEGNDDNDFRIGLKFTRKTVKFFAQFYTSDMILASPLGLRRAIKADDPKHTDYDFLSSIEICILDQADAMLMQNWEHVQYAFEHLNRQPQNPHDCDFSRVRQWYLDGNGKYLRQTIVASAYPTPELNAVFNQYMLNISGKTKVLPEYTGSMLDIDLPIRQTFYRYNSTNPVKDPDQRFDYFTTIILPSITKMAQPAEGGIGVLIFIPSYYDFVRVRNHFAGDSSMQDLSFGAISEYTEASEMSRARSHFKSGRHSILLYTGRAHHFRRFLIRGVKRVFLYGLPENPVFYKELVGDFLGATVGEAQVHVNDTGAKALFSKWDTLALERIVGTKRVKRMVKENTGDTFDFR